MAGIGRTDPPIPGAARREIGGANRPAVMDAEHWDDVDARFARAEGLAAAKKTPGVAAAVPIGRMARPEEIAGLAVFLAGDDAGYVVAKTEGIDGGNWMS